MLGHWEIRRHHGDDDETVNRKLHQSLAAGLRPILLIGEAVGERERALLALQAQLVTVLDGCEANQVAQMLFVYEPEWTIGVAEPAPALHVDMGCRFIRGWLAAWCGEAVGQAVRVIYGGSVSLEYAPDLLTIHDLDGLGATRKGRDPATFAQLVRLIAQAKGLAGR
jgi:triosephosphate isomerase